MSPSPLTVAITGVGTLSLAIGLLCLLVASRLGASRAYFPFALAALAAAVNAFVELWICRAATPAAYGALLRWQTLVQIAWWIFLVAFLVHYTGVVRRRLAILVVTGLVVSGLIHLASPQGLLFAEIRELLTVELPWGETVVQPVGTPNPWRWVGDLTILGLIVLGSDTSLRLRRAGQRRRANFLGLSFALLLAAMVHGSLVDLLIIRSPIVLHFSFVGLILLTGYDLAMDVVRASELARELVAAQKDRDQATRQLEEIQRRYRLRPPSDWDRRQDFRVLVVDDAIVLRVVAVQYLEVLGYHSEAVADGVEALAALSCSVGAPSARREGRFDAVLLDCEMPRLDGYETVRRLRRREAGGETGGRRLTVIAVTADDTARQRCLTAGMDDFLVKPFDGDEIATTLDRWLLREAEEDDATEPAGSDHLDALRKLSEKSGEDVLGQVVAAFLAESPGLLDEMRGALAAADLDAVARAAHKMKGSARVLRAPAFKELCADLEKQARAGDAAGCAAGLDAVDGACRRFSEELARQPD